MERCFICFDELINDFCYLPMMDEYIGQNISIFKNTFIIKKEEPFEFLYYYVCNKCVDNYIKYHQKNFKYLKKRELGIK